MPEEEPLRRGRPRNPDVEDRVFDAVMALYSQVGWSGFTIDAIAKQSGIGKAAIYRRWSSRGALLAQAFEARWYVINNIDTGNIRTDLIALTSELFNHMTGQYGDATLHMSLDRKRFPEVRESTEPYTSGLVHASRAIVRRAVQRGELPKGTDPTLALDLIVGGVTNHVAATPSDLRPAMESKMHAYGETLVDTILRGISPQSP